MNGQELESVKSHPYLGVELTQSLNWNNHITNITTKANRSLGFIKRCPEQIKDQAYKSLVRPHVEYASLVWSHNQKYQVDKLEKRAESSSKSSSGEEDELEGENNSDQDQTSYLSNRDNRFTGW
ncbi:uncharacterized protein [Acropora muricata]|uniref:uncharacterized protein n=1 Tax=Acropora muricata TaxID=159855 RepID=UPI0034E54E75